MMDKTEFKRLMGYWNAKKNAPPQPSIKGRSHVKGQANGYGQVLKGSFVKNDVHVERIFNVL